jgi:flagellar M-ring protein FliF
VPIWKQPENISLAKEAGKGLALAAGLLVLVFGLLRPAMKALAQRPVSIPQLADSTGALASADAVYTKSGQSNGAGAAQLADVRQLAKQDPATVANVVRAWVNKDG